MLRSYTQRTYLIQPAPNYLYFTLAVCLQTMETI